jgi:hypothetical protein
MTKVVFDSFSFLFAGISEQAPKVQICSSSLPPERLPKWDSLFEVPPLTFLFCRERGD